MQRPKTVYVREPSVFPFFKAGKQHKIVVSKHLFEAASRMVEAYKVSGLGAMAGVGEIEVDGVKKNMREYYMSMFDEAEAIAKKELNKQEIPDLSTEFIYTIAETIMAASRTR